MTVRHIVTRLHPDDKLDPDKTRPTGAKPGTMRQVSVNLRENPIDWLHARGQLSDRQRNAGERLRRDYERASLSSRVAINWDNAARASGQRRAAPSPPDLGASQIGAKRRFDGAIADVGPGLSDICWRIVWAGEGMAMAEKGLGWPARSGRLVLGLALDRLADFYGVR